MYLKQRHCEKWINPTKSFIYRCCGKISSNRSFSSRSHCCCGKICRLCRGDQFRLLHLQIQRREGQFQKSCCLKQLECSNNQNNYNNQSYCNTDCLKDNKDLDKSARQPMKWLQVQAYLFLPINEKDQTRACNKTRLTILWLLDRDY